MSARVFLGHGASGTAASMRPYVEGLQRRGIGAAAVDLPKRKAEQAVAAFLRASSAGPDIVVGGHSYGGRVASLCAAQHRFAALVLFSYPLHRPGNPEWEPRTAHWPAIHCPVLLLSGESDPFARVDLLRQAVGRLRHAELVTYPGVRHGVRPVLEDALDRAARFIRAALADDSPPPFFEGG